MSREVLPFSKRIPFDTEHFERSEPEVDQCTDRIGKKYWNGHEADQRA